MHKILVAFLLIALPLTASATECRYSAPRNADLDAVGLSNLQLNLGSTDLEIQGVQGLTKIEVRGTACASDQSWLNDLQVKTNRNGSSATVEAQNEHNSFFGGFGSSYAYLKLQVRVPASLAASVQSGSGDVNATSLASLDFHSGSGDLVANQIAGELALRLGSADARARQVGSVNLQGTGSGDVDIDGVRGDVQANRSGSGDLTFSNVSGSVNVGHTGSGDVRVRDIGRDVTVESTGSGDVSANGVGGNFTVHANGSGDITHSNVKGTVSVPKRNDE